MSEEECCAHARVAWVTWTNRRLWLCDSCGAEFIPRSFVDTQIAAVVATIGGIVEGSPTHQLNYLQRLRELVETERRRDEHEAEMEHHADAIVASLATVTAEAAALRSPLAKLVKEFRRFGPAMSLANREEFHFEAELPESWLTRAESALSTTAGAELLAWAKQARAALEGADAFHTAQCRADYEECTCSRDKDWDKIDAALASCPEVVK